MSMIDIMVGIIVFILCSGLAYYLYSRKKSKFVKNDEYKENDTKQQGSLILFYVNWCPYSQDALTKWETFKYKYNNPKFIIDFSETDCDKYSEVANKYNITEYPTIILVKDSKNYEYDANLSEDSLNLFINTVMKQ